jgi:hypothetical protein
MKKMVYFLIIIQLLLAFAISVNLNAQCLTGEEIYIVNADITHVKCYDGSQGAIDITVGGGSSAYTYNWSNGDDSNIADSLAAGTYYVTVTDTNGCDTIESFVINQPSTPIYVTDTIIDTIQCQGSNSGYAVINVDGGIPPYSYSWSSGSTVDTAKNLAAGTHTVTITDSLSCSKVESYYVPERSSSIYLSDVDITNIDCSIGDYSGAVSIIPDGGTAPYDYAWSNGDTTNTADGLGWGTYTVTVTDTIGACLTELFRFFELQIEDTLIAKETCYSKGDASLQITPFGGTGAYDYNWNTGDTTNILQNITSGTYSVTVTDSLSCTVEESYQLPMTDSLDIDPDVTPIQCPGEKNGRISVYISGGNPDYSFQWNTGDEVQNLFGLGGGTYIVTVTDAKGCSKTDSIVLNQPDPIALNAFVSDVSVQGAQNGFIELNITGGTPGFDYDWDNGDSTANIYSLDRGNYCVTVTDTFGCSNNDCYYISAPSYINLIDIEKRHVTCQGNNDGYVDLTVDGGVEPYEYYWSTGATTQDIHNLDSGFYSLTITDATNDSLIENFAIGMPNAINIQLVNLSSPVCAGDANASLDIDVSGGWQPYQYEWDNSDTTQDLQNVTSGTYHLTLTDNNSCSVIDSFTIPGKEPMDIDSDITGLSCSNCSDGAISLTVTGANPPYYYSWTTGDTLNSSISNLSRGSYAVTVTDDLGCIDSSRYYLEMTPPKAAEVFPQNNATIAELDTTLYIRFDQDVDSVDFSSITIEDQQGFGISGIQTIFDSTNNIIYIKHNQEFEVDMDYEVTIPAGAVVNEDTLYNAIITWNFSTSNTGVQKLYDQDILVYPVPAKDVLYVKNQSDIQLNKAFLTIYNILGEPLYHTHLKNNNINTISIDLLTQGTYVLEIFSDEEVLLRKIILVDR